MKAKIVLIEDDEILLENMVYFLEKNEYQVVSATNGNDGVSKIKSENPDLVISDINLPDISGYDIFNETFGKENARNVPFIFLTANTSLDSIRKGLQLGVDDYLTKPFKYSDLIETIEIRLKKYRDLQNSNSQVFDLIKSQSSFPFIKLEGDIIVELSENISNYTFNSKPLINQEYSNYFEIYSTKNEDGDEQDVIRSGQNQFNALIIKQSGTSYKWILFIDNTDSDISKQEEFELTDREFEIATEMAKGLTNQEIGENIHLSIRTVDWHRTNIFSKLDVRNRAEFIIKFTLR